jgi:hypothetical protein
MDYKFETTFTTATNKMFHKFSDRVSVLTDLSTGTVKLIEDKKIIREYKNVSLDKYDMIIYMAGEMANLLDKKSPLKGTSASVL